MTATGDAEHSASFRDALREIVAASPHDNVELVEGPDFVDASGMSSDLLHPCDDGMAAICENLAARFEAIAE